MTLRGLLSASFDEVDAHRLRTALSILSVVVGVATLTLIVALGDISRAVTQAVIEREAGRAATLELGGEAAPAGFASEVIPRILTRLDRYGASRRTRLLIASGFATFPGGGQPVAVYGVDPSLDKVRRLRVLAGRWLTNADGTLFAPVVVLNRPMLAASGLAIQDAIGSRLPLALAERRTARIVGVIDDGQRDGRIYMPSPFLMRPEVTSRLTSATVLVTIDPPESSNLAARVTADVARAGQGPMRVVRLDVSDDFSSIVTILQVVLTAIAAISLVSGSLGILNLGLVTVRQRAREFAIRRSFGAARVEIFGLVLAESFITAAVAGVLGIAIAAVAISALPLFVAGSIDPADLPAFPITAAMSGLFVAIGVGLIGGVVPALRATQVSIIHTIRS